METEEVTSEESCLICRGKLVSPVNLCASPHEQYCSPCWVEYVESLVHSSYMGACPCVHCPSEAHRKNKRKSIVPYSTWSALCSHETNKKFCSLAGSLLSFLCGGCHALKSLDVGFDATGSSSAKLRHTLEVSSEERAGKTEALDHTLQSLQVGELPVDEVYEKLLRDVFTDMSALNDHDAWEIFVLVLKTIPDPERRANLHLRYLRDRPRIRTLCCNREHCFHCKTKDFHEGKSCMEHTNTLDHSIVTCPACGIALAKGDGCNTITCVCGKQFSWTAEKENTDRCRVFFETHPAETNAACARVLCESRDSSEVVRARAWQGRNRLIVASCLKAWFREHYPQCTTQCAIVLPAETFPEGVREAMDVWIQAHPKDVEQRRKQNDIALRSIFLSLVPCESERPQAAHRIVSSARHRSGAKVDRKLVESATRWIESNKETYQHGVEAMEERLAKQFLFTYGSRPVFTVRPSQSSFPCAVEWCRSTSNHDLTFTNNYTSVERVGSVSCYPAAFAALVAERCMMRVIVDAAPRSSNWLTFGVARRGMASSSSDGVGRTSNSWGISDDRSSAASRAIVASCGSEVDSFRKLVVGDVLTALIDVTEGWAEVSVNDNEYTHRFSIPGGTLDEYVFAMSFANDHRVTILSEPALIAKEETVSASAKPSTDDSQNKVHGALYTTTLNPEQTAGFNQLRKRVKALLDSDDDSLSSSSGGDSGKAQKTKHCELFSDSSLWMKRWDGSNAVAQAQFDALRPTIEILVGTRKNCDSNALQSQSLAGVSWNTIVEALSWYFHNRERLRAEQRADMAYTFSVTHGDDAPFLAAMTLHEFHQRRLSRSEAEGPLAFMQFFQEEMNEWYHQDSLSREPMIENIAKGCRCLPRHIRSCPLAKANKNN